MVGVDLICECQKVDKFFVISLKLLCHIPCVRFMSAHDCRLILGADRGRSDMVV